MDVFLKFGNLEQSLGRFQESSQQYMDAIAGLQQIMQQFEGGGFMGECGDMFNNLLNRDAGIIQEFADIFGMAAGLLGETIGEFTEGDSDIQSKMPG